ncbi:MAG: hypothetical protein JJU27_17815 [Gammaproteobacteria bacterium]|nr:hypothetical protein [Gammaproteobacteria bacterium]
MSAILSGGLIMPGYWVAQRVGENRLAQGMAQPWEFTFSNRLFAARRSLAQGRCFPSARRWSWAEVSPRRSADW